MARISQKLPASFIDINLKKVNIWISIYKKIMLIPSSYFKCLSDETRLRCMMLLHQEDKLCVCELTHALELSQPKISRHLAQLRQCELVSDSREGQWVYYRVNKTLPKWASDILDVTISTMKKDKTYKQDIKRLKMMMNRPGEVRCP